MALRSPNPKTHTPESSNDWAFSYLDLARLTGMTYAAVVQHKTRKNFDPQNLESVILWIARHAEPGLRQQILHYSLTREPLEKPGTAKKPKAKKQQ